MTESLRAAASLAEKLKAIDLDEILPETTTVIECDDLAVDRIELRQVAGISAGGRLELSPGCEYDFGPVKRGHGRLDDGQPDTIGFTLSLDADMVATVGPGTAPLLIDAEPVVAPTDLGDRVINAGSARFVVARPRPPRKRDGRNRDDARDMHPWLFALIPGPLDRVEDPSDLVDRRRRLHYGPDEISYRIDGGGALLWDRGPDHPLFGTAVVAMDDVPITDGMVEISVPAPVSIDLLGSPTMLAGDRALQLAVARSIVLSLAATIDPRHLALELRSGCDDLAFINRLPHAAPRPAGEASGWVIDDDGSAAVDTGPRRLVVVDRPQGHNRRLPPGFHSGHTSFLVLTGETDALSSDADVLTLTDEAAISVYGRVDCEQGRTAEVRDATPVGFAEPMADELVNNLVDGA